MRRFLFFIAFACSASLTDAQTVATFDNLSLPKPDTFYVNYSSSGNDVGVNNGLAHFPCVYDTSWGGFWSYGFAYSNKTDSVTSGFMNQYSAKTASGYNGSPNYMVSYGSYNMIRPIGAARGKFMSGFYITNSTYAYNSMRDGDAFAKKFGGTSGTFPDWFKLVIKGFYKGSLKADSVEVYLADFRFPGKSPDDYILNNWKWVSLMPLGNVDSIQLELSSTDMGTWGMNTPAYYCMDEFTTYENSFRPYPPQATITGSTAIHKSDTKFVGWATGVNVVRGPMYIANPTLGNASAGDDTMALNMPDGAIVSLGDAGTATLSFNGAIYNGAGADFAVFENGFPNPANPEESFMELAFVEVSSDGQNFYRLPAVSLTDTTQVPMAGVYMHARNIHNLAGKYIANYGTPFDLQDLAGTQGLNINNITHVRVVDAIGDVGPFASLDVYGRKVNDPYPTSIATGGFDLDAVGVIHATTGIKNTMRNEVFQLYPNPATDKLMLIAKNNLQTQVTVTITDMTGRVMLQQELQGQRGELNVAAFKPGVYSVILTDARGNKWTEKLTKY
jgi:hypothetical protein